MSAQPIRVIGATLYFLPVQTRLPLKFGSETLTSVTCARARLTVRRKDGAEFHGWGETPLSVQWVWPSSRPYEPRHARLKQFCCQLTGAWAKFDCAGHALEVGHAFLEHVLPREWQKDNASHTDEAMPWLAALVCCSAFDIALHDAWGIAQGRPLYETYTSEYLTSDLSAMLRPDENSSVDFAHRFPSDYLVASPPARLLAWHLVGGKDPVSPADLDGSEPNDGYPVLLSDWIDRDQLRCLKIKLRGNDALWDYQRLVTVGALAIEKHVLWLTADFNCTVSDPAYVTEILDRLMLDQPRIYGMILYVEQPFPYELEEHPIDVRSVSARKPLFMDESAHDWRMVALGRELGWTGVALKTCKTQSGALLSACWARARGMTLMVQDLTNPMLAQIPHLLLAAHVGTIMGVETNSMQFYPEASAPEARVHPGLYQRCGGQVDLSSMHGPGFGYRFAEIHRTLPPPAAEAHAG